MSPATVVLAADNDAYRDGLARAIRAHAGLRLLESCADAASALDAVVRLSPDVCLIDIALRPFTGLELCRRIGAAERAGVRCVVMSTETGSALTQEAETAGAQIVVDKDIPRAELCELLAAGR